MRFLPLLGQALTCTCPRCGVGALYANKYDLRLQTRCTQCHLNLAGNDSADGPAVFLIFILGFLLVPLAVFIDSAFHPSLWVHGVLWGTLALTLTLGSLKPIKALVLLIQYRTRPETWET